MLFCFRVRLVTRTLSTGRSPTPPREMPPPNRIRVETALSRFPIHSLARRGTVTIDLQRLTEAGVVDFKWEVTYNSKHGQAGPLAYKVDTLVINRLLDQIGRPLPELIRIGSLSDVCRALGTQDTGPNIANLKSAFLQNASAFINAKIRYKTRTGREKWAEMGYTRYSVVFTGEALPDGRVADAVYIVLNPPYRELLNHVETRPLDYDYLKKLSPGPQRFYELLSFQIYGAIASGRERAKMRYSDYCKYAPQTRYADFDHVKKQMYKLHVAHRESGYITRIEYEETTDPEGASDWEMFYTPGPKAFAEYEAFTHRHSQRPVWTPPAAAIIGSKQQQPLQTQLGLFQSEIALLTELTARGVAEKKARELLSAIKPGQELMDQLEYVDWLVAKDKRRSLQNPPGLYVCYVRDNITPPRDFPSTRKMKLHEQVQQTKDAEAARKAHLEIEYDEYRAREVERFITEVLPAGEYTQMFEQHRARNRAAFRTMTQRQVDDLADAAVRAELQNNDRVKLLSFKDFLNTMHP